MCNDDQQQEVTWEKEAEAVAAKVAEADLKGEVADRMEATGRLPRVIRRAAAGATHRRASSRHT
jgi:hypothetical protein